MQCAVLNVYVKIIIFHLSFSVSKQLCWINCSLIIVFKYGGLLLCLWFTPGNRFCAENDVGTSISGHLRDRPHLVATGKDRRRALGFAKIELTEPYASEQPVSSS